MKYLFRTIICLFVVIIFAALVFLRSGADIKNVTTSETPAGTSPREANPQLSVHPNGELESQSPKSDRAFGLAPPSSQRLELDHDLLQVAASDGLDAARNFIRAKYPAQDREIALRFLLSEIGKSDFGAVLTLFPSFTSKQERQGALGGVAAGWMRTNPEKFLKLVGDQTSGVLKNELLQQAMNVCVNDQDWQHALQVIDRLPYSRERSASIEHFGRAYAASDSVAALTWASSLDLPEDRSAAQRSIIASFHSNGNMKALASAIPTLPPEVRGDAKIALGRLAMAQEIPVGQLLEENTGQPGSIAPILMGAIESATQEQLAAIIPETQRIGDAAERNRIAGRIADKLFGFDQHNAITWAMALSGGEREAAMRAIVSNWYGTDSIQLSDWVNTLPAGIDQDIARETIAGRLRSTDLSLAKEVAKGIHDATRRNAVLRSLP